MKRWEHDIVLRALEELPNPAGSLISAFPGRAGISENVDWIDEWFVGVARKYAAGTPPDHPGLVVSAAAAGVLSPLAKAPVRRRSRLRSLQPQHFRGFRACPQPIDLSADLVLIEGGNSTGKTSLSEALEWLLTGVLSRRESGQYGSARELAGCISNGFRPAEEATWVKALVEIDGRPVELKRTLIQDYTDSGASRPTSVFTVDGEDLSSSEEHAFFEDLFAGVHPILMQHTLREFVHNSPEKRRAYFERLLQVDELTALIEKAVVGKPKLNAFPNPTGSQGLAVLRRLGSMLNTPGATATLQRIERTPAASVPSKLRDGLLEVARLEFPEIGDSVSFEACRQLLVERQVSVREHDFPILALLRKTSESPSLDYSAVRTASATLNAAVTAVAEAEVGAAGIAAAERAVASVFKILISEGLIDPTTTEAQTCPVCMDAGTTLQGARLAEVQAWLPLTELLQTAKDALGERQSSLHDELDRFDEAAGCFAAALPPHAEFEESLGGMPAPLAGDFSSAYKEAADLARASRSLQILTGQLRSAVDAAAKAPGELTGLRVAIGTLTETEDRFTQGISRLKDKVSHLDATVAEVSRQDAEYLKRDLWREVADSPAAIASEIAWGNALKSAQRYLENLRLRLIETRGEIIEEARRTFTASLSTVWAELRRDVGARFSQLAIPEARGKGYKLELEVKAAIEDAAAQLEVDALRIFSESQINVIGLAAYITRARLLGHQLLIFNDPVQSMDAEHFDSFSSGLLPGLLAAGNQVLILTHSETFARKISHAHFMHESFATISERATGSGKDVGWRRRIAASQKGSRAPNG